MLRDNALPRLEVSLLLAHVLGRSRESVLAHAEELIQPTELKHFDTLRRRRLEGQPVAHLIGWREFYGLRLRITPEVLIPRPETETLVDAALERLPAGHLLRVLDLGTGSGAVAIAIARMRPAACVEAVDVSAGALAIATANAASHMIGNVAFWQGDWFSSCGDACYDLIVSNPPYVNGDDAHLGEGDVRFEPRLALTPGIDGLSAIRQIASGAGKYLRAGGWLLLEHGYDQGAACRDLLQDAGLVEVSTRRDLAGIERVVLGRKPPLLPDGSVAISG